MVRGFGAFIIRRSVTALIVVGVVVTLTVILIYSTTCARIEAIKADIRRQIIDEIAAADMKFPSAETLEVYVHQRMQEELAKRGLDICG